MLPNTLGYFEIQSSKPAETVEFYKQIFGWNFTKDENLPIEYYRIETGGIMGAILARPVDVPPMQYGTNAFTCSFKVEHFDEVAEKILALGGQIAMPKFAVPGRCWQGYFIDNDHNVFGLFEVDEQAK